MPWRLKCGPTFQSSPSPKYVTSGSMTPPRVTTAPCSKWSTLIRAPTSWPTASTSKRRRPTSRLATGVNGLPSARGFHRSQQPIRQGTLHRGGRGPYGRRQHECAKAIAHNVCGAPPVKLSKADWKPYALIKRMLQNQQKLAKENADTNGWNITEETTAVTEQFCAAVKAR